MLLIIHSVLKTGGKKLLFHLNWTKSYTEYNDKSINATIRTFIEEMMLMIGVLNIEKMSYVKVQLRNSVRIKTQSRNRKDIT